jgi:ribosome-associated translation inhibitor RaiA
MDMNVYFSGWRPATTVRDNIAQGMSDALQRFERHIRQVNVYVEDVNGPKGGVDKVCRCVLHLNRMPPLVIEDRDASLIALLDRITNRVAYSLSKRVARNDRSKNTALGHLPFSESPFSDAVSPLPDSSVSDAS